IGLVARGKVRQGGRNALGRINEPLARRVFAEFDQQFSDQILDPFTVSAHGGFPFSSVLCSLRAASWPLAIRTRQSPLSAHPCRASPAPGPVPQAGPQETAAS